MSRGEPNVFCAICGRGLYPGDVMCHHTEIEVQRYRRDGCACGEEHDLDITVDTTQPDEKVES